MDKSTDSLLPGDRTGESLGCVREANPEQVRPHRLDATRNNRLWILYFVTTLIFGAVFYVLGSYSRASDPRASIPQAIERNECGNTTEEAKSNGCVLDFISGAWVHSDCYDKDLEAEFLAESDWHWYSDMEGEHELSEDFIRQTGGTNPVYVSMAYHDMHCAYTLMKLHRAVLRQTPIDSHIGLYKHTQHCSKILALPGPFVESTGFRAPSGFYHIFTSCDFPQNCKYKLFPIIILVYTDTAKDAKESIS